MNPFQNYEEWRLIALAELLDMLHHIQFPNGFEDVQSFCDRLHSTAKQFEQLTTAPTIDFSHK